MSLHAFLAYIMRAARPAQLFRLNCFTYCITIPLHGLKITENLNHYSDHRAEIRNSGLRIQNNIRLSSVRLKDCEDVDDVVRYLQ